MNGINDSDYIRVSFENLLAHENYVDTKTFAEVKKMWQNEHLANVNIIRKATIKEIEIRQSFDEARKQYSLS